MKRMIPLLAAAAMLGGAAHAATFEEMDGNGDGMLTLDELLVSYPALTETAFVAIDINADGLIDADELAAAVDGGMLPEAG